MITVHIFDKYKQFREQADCPFCRREDIPYGDGLYLCALDKKFNPLQEKIISRFKRNLFPVKMSGENIHNEILKAAPSFYAWNCEGCGRYWIEAIDGKMVYDNIFPSTTAAPPQINGVKPTDAIKILATKAYGFFEDEYRSSREFRVLISNYAEYRVKADVSILNGWDRRKEIEKPLIVHRDKIDEYLFSLFKASLLKKFPKRSYYQVEAQKLFSIDEFCETLARVFLDKLMVGFLPDLFYMLKDECSCYLRCNYPREAHLIMNNPDNMDGYFKELYGRSVKMIADCMCSLGINVPIIDADKIQFGPITIAENGACINIAKLIVFGDVNINT